MLYKEEDGASTVKAIPGMEYMQIIACLTGTGTVEELQTPESLAQSVACGARFIIQHLPPLEGVVPETLYLNAHLFVASLPSLQSKPAQVEASDEIPDLAAAAVALENAQDAGSKVLYLL